MTAAYERRRTQTEVVNEMPLYPTEAILWDDGQVPSVHYTGEETLHFHELKIKNEISKFLKYI